MTLKYIHKLANYSVKRCNKKKREPLARQNVRKRKKNTFINYINIYLLIASLHHLFFAVCMPGAAKKYGETIALTIATRKHFFCHPTAAFHLLWQSDN